MIVSIEEEYKSFLDDKRVALVGPSASTILSGNGPIIDSYDVVVRLNRALPIAENRINDVGIKTDVLYHSFQTTLGPEKEIDEDLWIECGVKYLCAVTHRDFGRNGLQNGVNAVKKYQIKWMDRDVFGRLDCHIISYANAGTWAIQDLLSYPIKELHIFGIDFMRHGYDPEYYKNDPAGWEMYKDIESIRKINGYHNVNGHFPDSQYQWFKNHVYGKDKRVKIEKYFEDMLNDPNYDSLYEG